MKTKWMIIPVLALALGCTKEIENNVTYIDGEFTLYASSGDNKTRTVLQKDGCICWSPADCINVFYGDRSGKFTSNNTQPAEAAEFTGLLGSFSLDGETEFMAAYPYSDETTLSGKTLSIRLPSEQTAVEGTFADDLFIAVARSKDYNLFFYNVCGGVKFSLARGDIKKVVFKGNNGESLAGRLSVGFGSDGKPQVSGIEDGSISITLVAPGGGTFKEGSFYYLVVAPQALEQGYTMELYSDSLVGTIRSDSPVTVRRSAWGVLKNLVPDAPAVLDDAIVLERKYMVYTTPDYSSSSFYTSTRFCYPSISLCFDNGQRLNIGYYEAGYWHDTYNEGAYGVYVILDDQEWYIQPRITEQWVQEKLVVGPDGRVQYYSDGEFKGEQVFPGLNLGTASSLYVAMSPYGWWYTHYHFMDDFKLTTPYQTIADDFNNGVLDLTIWEEPVNPDGVFVEDGVVKTIQKRTDQDFGLNSKPISLGPVVSVESVSLDKTSLELSVGGQMTLTASILPENATNKTVTWSSSDETVATVTSTGLVTGVAAGSAVITVTTADGGKTASCNVTVEAGSSSVAIPEAIDLGLPSGLKWASFNLGASRPEERGDHYAWGETEPYYSSLNPLIWKAGKEAGYYWSSYKWCMGSDDTIIKYCNKAESGYNGFIDNKYVLDPEDDAAHVNLDGNWRIPTEEEWEELRSSCNWEWTTVNGVGGRLVTGPNGHSIFIPVAGARHNTGSYDGNGAYYSSSSLYSYSPAGTYVLYFNSDRVWGSGWLERDRGFTIRPVYDDGTKTSIKTFAPTNIGPCSVEVPFHVSTQESVYNFGLVYSTNKSDPVVGNYGNGNYILYYSSQVGNSMIINGLKPNTTYYIRALITIGEEKGTKIYGNSVQFTTKGLSYSTEYVDLGLSVSWATCNLGSSSPSNVGAYYCWGETEPTSLQTGYKWGGSNGFTKYNASDGKVTLDASDDAAQVNLGGNWRMPTSEEITELRNRCTWAQATVDGVQGCSVTGPNGKSIFIPVSEGVAGSFEACILSSSLNMYYEGCQYVNALIYEYDRNSVGFLSTFRDWGTPVRPVYDHSDSAGGDPEDVGYDDWF